MNERIRFELREDTAYEAAERMQANVDREIKL